MINALKDLIRFICALYAQNIKRTKRVIDAMTQRIFLTTKMKPIAHSTLSGYSKCRCTENSGLSDGSHVSSETLSLFRAIKR